MKSKMKTFVKRKRKLRLAVLTGSPRINQSCRFRSKIIKISDASLLKSSKSSKIVKIFILKDR